MRNGQSRANRKRAAGRARSGVIATIVDHSDHNQASRSRICRSFRLFSGTGSASATSNNHIIEMASLINRSLTSEIMTRQPIV